MRSSQLVVDHQNSLELSKGVLTATSLVEKTAKLNAYRRIIGAPPVSWEGGILGGSPPSPPSGAIMP